MKKNRQLIYGRNPVVEALKEGSPLEKVMLQIGTKGELEREVRQLCKEREIPLQMVPAERFNRYTRGNHQGLAAYRGLITYYHLNDVLPGIFERGENPLIVILDSVTDVRNLGAIARTALAFGAQALVTTYKNTALVNAEAIKASAGALEQLTVCRETKLGGALRICQQSGLQIVAGDLRSETPLEAVDWTPPTALILGAEGEGIGKHARETADQTFKISQAANVESLNVAVASGIMLYAAWTSRNSG